MKNKLLKFKCLDTILLLWWQRTYKWAIPHLLTGDNCIANSWHHLIVHKLVNANSLVAKFHTSYILKIFPVHLFVCCSHPKFSARDIWMVLSVWTWYLRRSETALPFWGTACDYRNCMLWCKPTSRKFLLIRIS